MYFFIYFFYIVILHSHTFILRFQCGIFANIYVVHLYYFTLMFYGLKLIKLKNFLSTFKFHLNVKSELKYYYFKQLSAHLD